MYFLFPPSSAFNCITEWAVVAEPEKKSRTIEFLFVPNIKKSLINSIGLGLENTFLLNKNFIMRFYNSE